MMGSTKRQANLRIDVAVLTAVEAYRLATMRRSRDEAVHALLTQVLTAAGYLPLPEGCGTDPVAIARHVLHCSITDGDR